MACTSCMAPSRTRCTPSLAYLLVLSDIFELFSLFASLSVNWRIPAELPRSSLSHMPCLVLSRVVPSQTSGSRRSVSLARTDSWSYRPHTRGPAGFRVPGLGRNSSEFLEFLRHGAQLVKTCRAIYLLKGALSSRVTTRSPVVTPASRCWLILLIRYLCVADEEFICSI